MSILNLEKLLCFFYLNLYYVVMGDNDCGNYKKNFYRKLVYGYGF